MAGEDLMKQFTSRGKFKISGETIFMIRRTDAKSPLAEGEMPTAGEVVEIDGNAVVVEQASIMGDSEFRWWPEIAITVLDSKA